MLILAAAGIVMGPLKPIWWSPSLGGLRWGAHRAIIPSLKKSLLGEEERRELSVSSSPPMSIDTKMARDVKGGGSEMWPHCATYKCLSTHEAPSLAAARSPTMLDVGEMTMRPRRHTMRLTHLASHHAALPLAMLHPAWLSATLRQ